MENVEKVTWESLEKEYNIKFKLEMKNIVCPVCKEYNIIK